jgi:hypothetical protein
MGKLPAALIIDFIVVAVAMEGGFGPAPKVVVTLGPSPLGPSPTPSITTQLTPTATSTPVPGATVTAASGTTTVRGSKDQLTRGVMLGDGVFVVSWSSSGTYLGLSLTDADGRGAPDISNGQASGRRLFDVDDDSVRSGEFTLSVQSDADWSVTISRPDTSSPSDMPLSVACSEQDGAIAGPFSVPGGVIKVSYSLSRTTQGNGYVNVYDASTGRFFRMRPIAGDSQAGQAMSLEELPAGVYIAQVSIPAGAKYADVTISQ